MRSSLRVLAIVSSPLSMACSTTSGKFDGYPQFVPPNSEITMLGGVSASETKLRFMSFGLSFSPKEIMEVHQEALSHLEGANTLVNLSQDTTVTSFPFLTLVEYSMKATAAKVTVIDERSSAGGRP